MARRRQNVSATALPTKPDTQALGRILSLFRQMKDAGDGTPEAAGYGRRLRTMADEVFANCFWIINKVGQAQLLVLNHDQRQLLAKFQQADAADEPCRVIVAKVRQKGLSTLTAAWHTLNLITRPNTKAAVMAHNAESGQALLAMYQVYIDNFPDELELGRAKGSAQGRSLKIEGCSSAVQLFIANEAKRESVGRTGRASTMQMLHLSELAFWNNPSATMNALKQCVPAAAGTSMVIESTAQMWGDTFHTEWRRAHIDPDLGGSDFEPLFIDWFGDSEYSIPFESRDERDNFIKKMCKRDDDTYGNELYLIENFEARGLTLEHLKWRRWKIRNDFHGNVRNFEIEYPATAEQAFKQSQGNWLNPAVMDIYDGLTKDPVAVGDFKPPEGIQLPKLNPVPHGWVEIWEHPQPFVEYIIGSDSSEGNESGDFNCAYVYRRNDPGIVCEIRGRDFRQLPQTAFAYQLYWAALYYNMAWINPESNYGQVIRTVLEDQLAYPKLLRSYDLRLGGLRMSTNPSKVGWWKSGAIGRWAQVTAREWFEGHGSSAELEPKFCPSKGLILEARSCIMEKDVVKAPKKGSRRPPGDPEDGYYDDRVHALYGCLIADAALPDPRDPLDVEDEIEMSDVPGWMDDEFGIEKSSDMTHYSGLIPRSWV